MSKNKHNITQLESISSSSTSTVSSQTNSVNENNNLVVTDEVRIILEEIVQSQLESMKNQSNSLVTNKQIDNTHSTNHNNDQLVYTMKDMSKDLYIDNKDDAEYILSHDAPLA